MVKIVRMSENKEDGSVEPFYPETHAEAVVGLDTPIDAAVSKAKAYTDGKFTDSGWINLSLKAGFGNSSGDSVPQYRKIGNKVEVRGLLARTNDLKGSFCSIPVGYRTSSNYNQGFTQGQQSSAAGAVALIYVKASGDMEVVSAINNTSIWLDGIYWYTD
ncbi:hypothetical protein G0Q17_001797 [Listeria monocytogenes]|uniref:hypothetical protein n=1 Tax=Listeria monocytogenes TaxID=1639 RepID=UPI000E763242|nr:hypothetical protein [Listeria monocytogenes]EAE5878550.1 hypothetical protein [Listeria monocytogenes]EDP7666794.1 hypothetical protein [Listeria monocytogenes]EEO3389651.1 hypothetical protein [Listeria monocytogenes]EEO3692676.1 hypothetical protein [Listeria monocytogenes]EEO6694461.1 hypothetical protein [Listeria monocytogenes]